MSTTDTTRATIKDMSAEEAARALETAHQWDSQPDDLRAWSTPYAFRRPGENWGFAVLGEGRIEPGEEARDLRGLIRA